MKLFNRSLVCVLSAIFLPACAAFAEGAPIVISTPNTVSIDILTAQSGQPSVIEHYFRHNVLAISSGSPQKYELITQEFNIGTGNFESYDPAIVKVDAKLIDSVTKNVSPETLWSLTTSGISGDVDQRSAVSSYRIITPGCCGSQATTKYFSLNNGMQIGSSTAPPVYLTQLLDKTSKARLLTLEGSDASEPFELKDVDTARSMATLFYSDGDRILEAVTISSAELDAGDWAVEQFSYEGTHADHRGYSADKHDFSGETLHIKMLWHNAPKRFEVVLPLLADGLNVDGAVITGQNGIVLKKTLLPSSPAIATHD